VKCPILNQNEQQTLISDCWKRILREIGYEDVLIGVIFDILPLRQNLARENFGTTC
jgi:hypothetical protein